ncbi:hypothetical protein M513_10646 [Trichuris suis]|uniref:Uncharacterized protein n=1 Tax=Trichuris suis TaxID=68888 RepID=A0A085LTY2_9BILA|nr:hypothetical protein M513_10646 [Trichuris suis]
MDEAIKASAIVEHASRCDGQMHPNVIANEPDFRLRKIKEALYIRHNVVINRDKDRGICSSGSCYWFIQYSFLLIFGCQVNDIEASSGDLIVPAKLPFVKALPGPEGRTLSRDYAVPFTQL